MIRASAGEASQLLRLRKILEHSPGRLILQKEFGEAEIQAPVGVLNALIQACDGSRSRPEIEAELIARTSWPFVSRFLDGLLLQGVMTTDDPAEAMSRRATVQLTSLDPQLPAAVTNLGFKSFQATVVGPAGSLATGFGRSTEAQVAMEIARSEACERHAYRHPSRAVRVCKSSALPRHMCPRTLVHYALDQYSNPLLALKHYSIDDKHPWLEATQLQDNEPTWCHAQLVYDARSLQGDKPHRALLWPTTSGCASDVNVLTAVERAGLELIERDAFARHWLAQKTPLSLVKQTLPTVVRELLRHAEGHSMEVDVGILQGAGGPAVITGCTHARQGVCVVSTACGNDLAAALEHSLAESLVTAVLRCNLPSRSGNVRPFNCRRAIDHGDLYAQRRYFRRAHAITRGPSELSFEQVQQIWPSSLQARLEMHKLVGAAWVDMTSLDAPLAPSGQIIRTARVLIPGLIPLAFGWDGLPRGMGAEVHPHGRFPHPLP